MNSECLKVYDLDNRITDVYIGDRDEISKWHCKRCGSRIIIHDGDPHNVAQCPVCKFYPPTFEEDYKDAFIIMRYVILVT